MVRISVCFLLVILALSLQSDVEAFGIKKKLKLAKLLLASGALSKPKPTPPTEKPIYPTAPITTTTTQPTYTTTVTLPPQETGTTTTTQPQTTTAPTGTTTTTLSPETTTTTSIMPVDPSPDDETGETGEPGQEGARAIVPDGARARRRYTKRLATFKRPVRTYRRRMLVNKKSARKSPMNRFNKINKSKRRNHNGGNKRRRFQG